MRTSFITTVNAWRFERPLAIALAASAIFMVMAVPPARLSAFPALAAFPAFQPVLAVIFGVLLGVLGYAAMSYSWPRVAAAAPARDEPAVPEDEQGQFAAGEVSLRLRRADRHPDAPVRAPIFASRDLGSPFMEVGAFAPPPAGTPDGAIPDGDYAEVEPAHAIDPVVEARPEPEPVVAEAHPGPAAPIAPAPPVAEPPSPIAAFAPEDEPAPARPQWQSIAAMMDRLSAGLERRAAAGHATVPSHDRAPALRDALDELNRIAARRG